MSDLAFWLCSYIYVKSCFLTVFLYTSCKILLSECVLIYNMPDIAFWLSSYIHHVKSCFLTLFLYTTCQILLSDCLLIYSMSDLAFWLCSYIHNKLAQTMVRGQYPAKVVWFHPDQWGSRVGSTSHKWVPDFFLQLSVDCLGKGVSRKRFKICNGLILHTSMAVTAKKLPLHYFIYY